MTNSIGDLLDSKRFDEPQEVRIIKAFVSQRFKSTPSVTVGQQQIIIGVQNAALAGALRPLLHQLQQECDTDKRLVIRIGV